MKTKNKREEKQFKFSSLSSTNGRKSQSNPENLHWYRDSRHVQNSSPLHCANPTRNSSNSVSIRFGIRSGIFNCCCGWHSLGIYSNSTDGGITCTTPKTEIISKPIFGIYLSTSTREFVCFALEFVYDPIPDNLKFRLPRTRNRKYLLRIQVAAQSTIS